MIREYAFNKVCSALGVGPQLSTPSSFDVICYEDAIQFSMEMCEQAENLLSDYETF